ncbi:MAG: VCBS repeat-containing protein, partial [Cytophagales bacterium]|nr:VCBS repeat-containing protein [Cytophagales bacterium]
MRILSLFLLGTWTGMAKADLAVTNGSGSSVSVFRNTGSVGTISYAAKVDFTTGSFPYSVSIGDLDGDGKADLALANEGSNTVSVFRNTGSAGTISYAAKVDFTTGSLPFSVSIGDLDGDGKADLAVANYSSNTVSVFRNTGSPGTISYAAKVDFTTGSGSGPNSVSIGDLDGDGKADLAVANYNSNTVSVIRNTGSAGTISYAAKVDFTTG